MSLRSAAAAALCAGLPAVSLAQPQPAPQPVQWVRASSPAAAAPYAPPVLHVERAAPAGAVTPASAVVRADPPKTLPNIPPVPAAQPTRVAPAPTPAPAAQPPARLPAHVDVPAKPTPAAAAAPAAPTFYPITGCPTACPEPCGPAGDVWGRFEWLYWAGSGQSLPPLVTVAPPGTPRAAAGVLGQPTTLTQFGGGRANNDFRDGFRFTGGWWHNDDRTLGFEGDFFFLSRSREGVATSSDGSAVIARPFFDAAAGVPAAQLVSFPGVVAGSATADATSQVIGGGISGLSNLCCDPCGRVDLVVGFRYLHVGDEVTVTENLTALGIASRVTPGTTFVVNDRFATSNDFYGGVIGVSGERRYGSFFVGGKLSVALGGVVQTTTIDGSTVIGGVAQTGGLLTQPSNIGRYQRSAFAVVPEVGLRAGFQVTESARVYGGYNFLYLSNVARAGDQIDPAVNPLLLPPRASVVGPAVPAFPDRTTDFWLQGVSLGVELRF
ncbi:BBP7 family outer membrane beta-barrel protein [Urbifossiella limnaea]|uniref:BBP7 family outer membrane beta-barrel protein n=1 Tax=Urbifossiella limnaea TaxID=2528023 RepID=A0A517XPJ9_9BACT|nr:BBP7 family outer membrane beta-barrel protein [Urbifossiella limnaea]QDU19433.1 hypothetical protein ETAA1_13570 [Urbifossiella limnaea]